MPDRAGTVPGKEIKKNKKEWNIICVKVVIRISRKKRPVIRMGIPLASEKKINFVTATPNFAGLVHYWI